MGGTDEFSVWQLSWSEKSSAPVLSIFILAFIIVHYNDKAVINFKLTERGDMSLNLQARLLRVLQEKQITRIGSDKVINLDIRVVAATNKDLPVAIKNKEFREDLYYRLCNIPISMPSLRDKKDDIALLFKCFVGQKYDVMTDSEINAIENYRWPGNVRELRNAADYYITLGELPVTILEEDKSENGIVLPKSYSEMRTEKIDIEEQVLSIIKEHTCECCGIGRTSILNELRARGISLSDDKLRKMIRELESQNKIKVGKGRIGCMIIQEEKK